MSQFSGYWERLTTGTQEGFFAKSIDLGGNDSSYRLMDRFIHIDDSTNPILIKSYYGTSKYPRTKGALDAGPYPLPSISVPNPAANAYNLVDSTTLVSVFNPPSNNIDSTLSQVFGPTLKLIDNCTIHAFNFIDDFYHPNFAGVESSFCIGIYKRIDGPPRDTINDDWKDPVKLFKYYISVRDETAGTFNNYVDNKTYIGNEEEKKITHQFLSKEGFTICTPLRAIRVTNKTVYSDLGITADTLTTFYTGCPVTNKGAFSGVVAGASPKIHIEGPCSILNGEYVNGVGIYNDGAVPDPNPKYVRTSKHGFQNLYMSFLLNADSSNLASLADASGLIKLPKGCYVKVKYKVNKNTEYHELWAACLAWYYQVYKIGTHLFTSAYCAPNSCLLLRSWIDFQNALISGNYNLLTDYGRWNQASPNAYYHNFNNITGFNPYIQVNCAFPLTYSNSNLSYDVVLGNYTKQAWNLYYSIQGTLQTDQPDPVATYGYNPIVPGPGRAQFVGGIFPAIVSNGNIINNPPPITGTTPTIYWSPVGDAGYDYGNLNAYYLADLKDFSNSGKNYGYLYLADTLLCDAGQISLTGIYSPENQNSINPKASREGLSQIHSEICKWINAVAPYNIYPDGSPRAPISRLIIDNTSNGGGSFAPFSLYEFFGVDRDFIKSYTIPSDPCEPLINNQDIYCYPTVNETAANVSRKSNKYWVSINASKYPSAIVSGTINKPFEIIMITDISAYSFGDAHPNFLAGKYLKHGKYANDLGNNVKAQIIGCVDGRNYSLGNSVRFPVNSNSYVNALGKPVSPFTFRADYSCRMLRIGSTKYSKYLQDKHIKPRCKPLAFNMEDLVEKDFGYLPLTSNKRLLPGQVPPNSNDPTTWIMLYLNKAIKY